MLINLRSDLAVGGLIADAVQNKKSKTEISAFKVFIVCVWRGWGVGRGSVWLKQARHWVEHKTDAPQCHGEGWGAEETWERSRKGRGGSLQVQWNPKDGQITSDCINTGALYWLHRSGRYSPPSTVLGYQLPCIWHLPVFLIFLCCLSPYQVSLLMRREGCHKFH